MSRSIFVPSATLFFFAGGVWVIRGPTPRMALNPLTSTLVQLLPGGYGSRSLSISKHVFGDQRV